MASSSKTLEQSWSAEGYDRDARFVSVLGGGILAWLAPRAGERILDLGCGDGDLTMRIIEAGAEVVGIDSSADFVRAAKAKGLDARLGDIRALEFDHDFDAVFSNAALHWVREPELVIGGAVRALKPNGRFVVEFGGHGNVAAITTAMRAAAREFGGDDALADPWYFPSTGAYRTLLEAHGFEVGRIELVPRPTHLPTGMAGWLRTFRQPFFDQFPEPERAKVCDRVLALLRPALCDEDGQWTADYVRLKVAAKLAG